MNNGDLFAELKPDATGDRTESVPLKPGLKSGYVKVAIIVKGGQLRIDVDGEQKLDARPIVLEIQQLLQSRPLSASNPRHRSSLLP